WIQEDGGRLRRATTRYLGQVDVGSESVPALGDLDADGDLDLLVGNKLDPGELRASRVYRFENVGDPGAPSYRLADTLNLGDAYHYAPVLVDLDADGDLDLVAGTWNDGVLLYRNEGTPEEPDFVSAGALVEITRGSDTTPAFADVDGDGDLDLMVGEGVGELNFYRNDGTAEEPRFVLVSDNYMGIDAGRRSHPSFLDVDGDGDPDLVVGREDPGALVFLNDGAGGGWEADDSFRIPLPNYGAPTYGDVDGDGDPDVVSGSLAGGLVYLEAR
ncbi:MAG TPA: FG-GAP-like repeat-containing protein, partial [Longimicrobiales bacterium]|nr:FG-GAP-like repeat-containing protein [Longimicrobiales bacterium]